MKIMSLIIMSVQTHKTFVYLRNTIHNICYEIWELSNPPQRAMDIPCLSSQFDISGSTLILWSYENTFCSRRKLK